MIIDCVNIKIIDTHDNDRVLIQEFAEAGSIQLIYNGQEDRFSSIVASELHFSMKVSDKADAKFLHLFTGSETRYRVEVEDATNAEELDTIWTGFLLPEQFSEPWTNNVFFVNFIATDGLGRVKEKTLSETFYQDIKGISTVFAECLKQTGLSFPIYIAPAIVNAVQDLKYSQIAVNTLSYIDKDKKDDAYTILEYLLVSMGCKLFQWNEVWCVVGINRFADDAIEFEEYDVDGVYVGQKSIKRLVTSVVFEEHPTINIQPPFKRVVVEWDKDQEDEILPADITYQPFDEPGLWYEESLPVVHWQQSESDVYMYLSSYTQYFNLLFTDGTFEYNPNITPLPTEDPFYLTLSPTPSGDDADLNYVSLANPIFLEGNSGDDKFVTLDLEFRMLSVVDLGATAFEDGDYQDSFQYELLLDDEILVSNKPSFTNNEGYQYTFGQEANINIVGKLQLKKIPINKNGYLDLRLSAPIGVHAAAHMVFKTVKITYNSEDETCEKIRDIDFSTKQEVEVFHGDDNMDITNRQWLFTDDVTVNIPVNTAAVTQQIEILGTEIVANTITSGGITITISWLRWYISEEQFDLINLNPMSVFVLDSTGTYSNWNIVGFAPVGSLDGQYYFQEIYSTVVPLNRLIDGNEIWLMASETNETITDQRYLRERWKRYEIDEEIRYTCALSRVYHDTVQEASIKIEGLAFGFYNPLEMLLFKFIDGKKFIVTNNQIAVDGKMTQLSLVENKKNNVTDYVAE